MSPRNKSKESSDEDEGLACSRCDGWSRTVRNN